MARLLNSALYRTGDRRAFMTLFYGVLEPESGKLYWIDVIPGGPTPSSNTGRIQRANMDGTLPETLIDNLVNLVLCQGKNDA